MSARPTAPLREPVNLVLLFCVLDESDSVANGDDLLSFLVGNRKVEFLFELHNQLDGVQRVCTKVVGEAGFRSDLTFLNTKFVGDDTFNSVCKFWNDYLKN